MPVKLNDPETIEISGSTADRIKLSGFSEITPNLQNF